jgi:hypothetical protein
LHVEIRARGDRGTKLPTPENRGMVLRGGFAEWFAELVDIMMGPDVVIMG